MSEHEAVLAEIDHLRLLVMAKDAALINQSIQHLSEKLALKQQEMTAYIDELRRRMALGEGWMISGDGTRFKREAGSDGDEP